MTAAGKPRSRVELLTALYTTKQAADADTSGPSAVATREMDQLSRGEDTPVSMACTVDPLTPVRVRGKGYIPIIDVQVGDYVWTHLGRWRPVTELKRRPYRGPLVRLWIEGGGRTVTTTADHPWYVRPAQPAVVDPLLPPRASESLLWTPAHQIGLEDKLLASSCHLRVPGGELEDFEKHSTRIGRACVVPHGVDFNYTPPQIPDAAFAAAEPAQLEFLGAWYDHQNLPKAWDLPDRPVFYAASLAVALGLRDLIHQLGLITDLSPEGNNRGGYRVVPRRTLSGFDAFSILGRHFDSSTLDGSQAVVSPNVLLEMPLQHVEPRDGSGRERTVYNFEVEEDHSYLMAGLVSHNCAIDYDVCNGCGNRAKTAKDYCGPDDCVKYGGCRDNLARTFDDGHTLAVDNYGCRWFDISHVIRPADRIAYGARVKTASDLRDSGVALPTRRRTVGFFEARIFPESVRAGDRLGAGRGGAGRSNVDE